jgi:cytochrome c-type biogenesis protein CcmE
VRFLVAALVAVAAVVALTVSSFDDQIYYFTVAEATAQYDDIEATEFRIKGNVVAESHEIDAIDLNLHTFGLQADGEEIAITFVGPLPDTFADNAEVIALGRLTAPGRFEAVEVIAKCPSRYEEGAPTAEEQASR